MPQTVRGSVSVSINGRAYDMDVSTSDDLQGGAAPSVGPAATGTLTVRTDNDTGTVTAATGHGIVTADKVDIYWDGGSRYSMAATVTGDSVVLDAGAGDNLPLVGTAVTLMKQNVETPTITGDNISSFGVKAPNYAGTVLFQQADGTLIFPVVLDAGGAFSWTDQLGTDNPLAGFTVGKITFTSAGSGAAQDMYVDYTHSGT